MCVQGDEWAAPSHNSLGLSKGPPPAGSVELDHYMCAGAASGEKASQSSPPSSVRLPSLPIPPLFPLLSMLLWVSRVFLPPALVLDLAIHSDSVKMT